MHLSEMCRKNYFQNKTEKSFSLKGWHFFIVLWLLDNNRWWLTKQIVLKIAHQIVPQMYILRQQLCYGSQITNIIVNEKKTFLKTKDNNTIFSKLESKR